MLLQICGGYRRAYVAQSEDKHSHKRTQRSQERTSWRAELHEAVGSSLTLTYPRPRKRSQRCSIDRYSYYFNGRCSCSSLTYAISHSCSPILLSQFYHILTAIYVSNPEPSLCTLLPGGSLESHLLFYRGLALESLEKFIDTEIGHDKIPVFKCRRTSLATDGDELLHTFAIPQNIDDIEINLLLAKETQCLNTPRASSFDIDGRFCFFSSQSRSPHR